MGQEEFMARVLVVDDEDIVRALIRRILSMDGHEVLEAANGKLAMRLFRESSPDVVITDIIMPEKEGLETIMEMRQEDPDVKIIAISGGSYLLGPGQNIVETAARMGAARVFTKPFDLKALSAAVRDLLAEPSPPPSAPSTA